MSNKILAGRGLTIGIWVVFAVLVALVLAGVVYEFQPEVFFDREEIAESEPLVDKQASQKYIDGVYSAMGEYRVPGGRDTIQVTLQVQGNLIESVNIENIDVSPVSESYIQGFNDGIEEKVVGVSLNDGQKLDPGIVNGASLTREGFLEAVQNIRSQASISNSDQEQNPANQGLVELPQIDNNLKTE